MTRDDAPAHRARVVRRALLTPHMARVTLDGVTPLDGTPFRSSGRADEFFGLWVPDGAGGTTKRYYTVRAWRPETGELDVDLMLHGHGPATRWAQAARVGEHVGLDLPRGPFRAARRRRARPRRGRRDRAAGHRPHPRAARRGGRPAPLRPRHRARGRA